MNLAVAVGSRPMMIERIVACASLHADFTCRFARSVADNRQPLGNPAAVDSLLIRLIKFSQQGGYLP